MSESAVPQYVLRKIKPAATYHQYGKTNVYTDGLNPAQIPYKWQKNPTLGEFCFNMIEGADIVWDPKATSLCTLGCHIPVVTFPTPLAYILLKTKGLICHASTVCSHTENQNQVSFYPFLRYEITFSLNSPQDICVIS